MVKKFCVSAGVLLLAVLLIGVVSAESCNIRQTTCAVGEYEIVKLSSSTNAHGELINQNNYDYILCCDFGDGVTTCDTTNKIIGLSSITNAHAEIPSLDNYGFDVCYENLECVGRSNECNPNEIGILSLSSNTNAHIGGFNDYTTKICCLGVCGAGEEYIEGECVAEQVAYWANTNEDFISSANVAVGVTNILLILKNTGLNNGTAVSFEIYEVDLLFDDLIKTINGVVDSNGDVSVSWTVTQIDIDNTGEPTNFDNFYFIANSETSNELTITLVEAGACASVSLCLDYLTEETCEYDVCEVGTESVEANNPGLTCEERNYDSDGCEIWFECECKWENNSCGPNKIEKMDPDCPEGTNNFPIIGECFYKENTNDDCDDGFLTYSWEGIWTWHVSNPIPHYDPNNKSEECINGSNTIPCPAQIKLLFFNFYNLIVTVMLIGLVYVFFNYEKKRK